MRVRGLLDWLWLQVSVRIRYRLTGDCGLSCDFMEPYGFVPECDCPIHDKNPNAYRRIPEWRYPK